MSDPETSVSVREIREEGDDGYDDDNDDKDAAYEDDNDAVLVTKVTEND